jgi:hypothetical protein
MPMLVRNLTVTSAIDLGLVDPIHLHAAALNRLGRRLARQALALAEGRRDVALGPRVDGVEGLPGERGFGLMRVRCAGVAGGWSPTDRITGFTVQDAAGEPIPGNAVFNAARDPVDPAAIRVWTNAPLRAGDTVAYGLGLNPPCGLVDAADMPLSAFVSDRI